MALKIDLEKAYDKLEWSFIRDTLLRFNLLKNLIELIMSYVSSVSTSILFNRESLDTFTPTRGIRQGDPLSSYIYHHAHGVFGTINSGKMCCKLLEPC